MATRVPGSRRGSVFAGLEAARALSTTAVVLIACLLVPPQLFAQSGTLRGWVRDAAGDALSGLQLEAKAQGGSLRFATSTGSDGSYQLLQLPAGVYDITVIDEADRSVCPRGVESLSVRDYELKELVLVVASDGSCEFVTLDGQPATNTAPQAAASAGSSASNRKAWIIALGSLAGVIAAIALLDSDDDPPATPATP